MKGSRNDSQRRRSACWTERPAPKSFPGCLEREELMTGVPLVAKPLRRGLRGLHRLFWR